jgi:hypothetical protein
MRRINFTLNEETVSLLGSLADEYYGGNRSLAVRAAVESLAAHSGHSGWVITGFTPTSIELDTRCHCCQTEFQSGSVLFRPVFEKRVSPSALSELPSCLWLDCSKCAGNHL